MGLILTEDQLILRDMAKGFFDEKSPVERMRELRDSRDEVGFSRDLWKEMGELGWITASNHHYTGCFSRYQCR